MWNPPKPKLPNVFGGKWFSTIKQYFHPVFFSDLEYTNCLLVRVNNVFNTPEHFPWAWYGQTIHWPRSHVVHEHYTTILASRALRNCALRDSYERVVVWETAWGRGLWFGHNLVKPCFKSQEKYPPPSPIISSSFSTMKQYFDFRYFFRIRVYTNT